MPYYEYSIDAENAKKIRNQILHSFSLSEPSVDRTVSSIFKKDKNGNKIDLFDRFCLVHRINLYFEQTDELPVFDSYADFVSALSTDLKSKASQRAKSMCDSVFYGNPQKTTIFLFCFCLDLTLDTCNALMKAHDYDELYSRNLDEGLMIYFFTRFSENSTLRSMEELFFDYFVYKKLTVKYNTMLSRELGKEFDDCMAKSLADASPKGLQLLVKKFSRRPVLIKNGIVQKKDESLLHYIACLKASIKKYESMSTQGDTPITTSIVLEQFKQFGKKASNYVDLENMIIDEIDVWCQNRNRPLKIFLKLMEAYATKKQTSFSDFAFSMFCFYFVSSAEDMPCLTIRNSYYKSDNDANASYHQTSLKSWFYIYNFSRDLTGLLFGINPPSRMAYITLLIFLLDLNATVPTRSMLDAFLSECGYAVLGSSLADQLIVRWLEAYACERKTNPNASMHDILTKEFRANPGYFYASPISWK